MPPFVLCLLDSTEIHLFPHLQALESSIEATDVVNGEYCAYDSVGFGVDLVVDELGAPRAVLSAVDKSLDLKDWILRSYRAVPQVSAGQTLPEMISSLKAIYRYGQGLR